MSAVENIQRRGCVQGSHGKRIVVAVVLCSTSSKSLRTRFRRIGSEAISRHPTTRTVSSEETWSVELPTPIMIPTYETQGDRRSQTDS